MSNLIIDGEDNPVTFDASHGASAGMDLWIHAVRQPWRLAFKEYELFVSIFLIW